MCVCVCVCARAHVRVCGVCVFEICGRSDRQAGKQHNLPTVWPLHTYCLQNEPKTYTLFSGQSQDSVPHSCIFGSLILDNKNS